MQHNVVIDLLHFYEGKTVPEKEAVVFLFDFPDDIDIQEVINQIPIIMNSYIKGKNLTPSDFTTVFESFVSEILTRFGGTGEYRMIHQVGAYVFDMIRASESDLNKIPMN